MSEEGLLAFLQRAMESMTKNNCLFDLMKGIKEWGMWTLNHTEQCNVTDIRTASYKRVKQFQAIVHDAVQIMLHTGKGVGKWELGASICPSVRLFVCLSIYLSALLLLLSLS